MDSDKRLQRADLATLWLLGDPVEHSLSPTIQNAALAELARHVVYLAARVRAADFASVLDSLPKLGALGANVTVPHKELAFQACTRLSERAQAIGAVNVLHFKDGEVVGDNTDGVGWSTGLRERFGGDVMGRPAVVIGAGGASRSIVHALCSGGCPHLTVLNRTPERAEALRARFSPLSSGEFRVGGLSEFCELLEPGCLVVQTTSVGLKSMNSPVPLPQAWPEGALFSELIYGTETALAQRVRELGGEVQDGLPMLCYQAAHGLARWLELPLSEIPTQRMFQVARRAI